MNRRNSMASASLVLGVLAMLSGSILFIAVPLGALSVLCALLSKTDRQFPKKSIAGMVIGIIAAVGSCVITAQSYHYIMGNPQVKAYYSEIMDTLLESYGLSDEYNPFRENPGASEDGNSSDPISGSDGDHSNSDRTQTPEDHSSDGSSKSSDDYFDSMYDDYFRYFYGVDPNYEKPTPENPSGNSSGGDFV